LQRVLDNYEIRVIKDYRDLDRFVLVNLS
jgi:hypothetical protein